MLEAPHHTDAGTGADIADATTDLHVGEPTEVSCAVG